MKNTIIPNGQYKVFIEEHPELSQVKAIVTTMDGRLLYTAFYRNRTNAINSTKRRLKIDKDRQNLLLHTAQDGRWWTSGWR